MGCAQQILASSGAAFVPSSLASLLGWYTAGPTWCFTDAGGTTPCGVGDLIYRWNDRSGGGYNLTQATSGRRPILRLSGGLYYAEFDGTDDGVENSSIPIGTSTIITGGAFQTSGAGSTRMFNGVANNCLVSPRRPTFGCFVGVTIKSTIGVADSNPRVITMQKATAGNWLLRLNGADQSGLSAVTNEWGNGFAWGYSTGTGETFAGGAYSLLIYNANYTGSDRTSIEQYVASLSAVTL